MDDGMDKKAAKRARKLGADSSGIQKNTMLNFVRSGVPSIPQRAIIKPKGYHLVIKNTNNMKIILIE
jgi:hypothetical protein